MRVWIQNLTATQQTIHGLGNVAAAAEATFGTNGYILHGRDGTGLSVAAILARMEAAGHIRYEIRLEAGDVGEIGRARLKVTAADLTDADTSQTFTHEVAFPPGAVMLARSVRIIEAFAAPTATAYAADIGIGNAGGIVDDDYFAAVANIAAEGLVDLAAHALSNRSLAGQHLQVKIDFTDDNVANATAGELDVDVIYTVA